MILDEILAQTRAELARRRNAIPLERLTEHALAASPPRGFAQALRARAPLGCIAEFKRRSPSAGWIREGADPTAIARTYTAAGAAALSVLTDGPFFGGSFADLEAARAAVAIPVLRKDFIVDRYQVVEARAHGADAILLIVAALDDDALSGLAQEAERWGLDVLVEAHTEREVDRAVALGSKLIGINHRDLRTFQMDTTLAVRMRDRVPADRLLVAESGIRTAGDVWRLRDAGIGAILVGESLMRAPDPGVALADLLTL